MQVLSKLGIFAGQYYGASYPPCDHPATESHHEARHREVRLRSPGCNPIKVPGTRYCHVPQVPATWNLFWLPSNRTLSWGQRGLGHRWGQHITHQLSCRLQLFGGNLCSWHVTVLQTCTNCDKLFEILWCPRPVLQRTKLWDPLIFFLFSRHCFRDLPIVRQQFKQSFVSPCRAFVQSDHKALFINTVFNIDQICQRYSCSGGTFLGTKMIICLQ